MSPTTVRRRFGSWKQALGEAGLGHRFSGGEGSKTAAQTRTLKDTDIIDRIRRLASELQKEELTAREISVHLGFSTGLLISRFGSTRDALRLAGLGPVAHGRRYTNDECLENLLSVWTYYGRQPTYQEMNNPPSRVGAKAYVSRFGGWMKALEAFVAQEDHPTDGVTASDETAAENTDTAVPDTKMQESDRREIRLGLRFEILKRDSFKCVLCGDSPATNPLCKLHVDHVVPFSRGGKTEAGNLRSLCETCNVGRGNRHLD